MLRELVSEIKILCDNSNLKKKKYSTDSCSSSADKKATLNKKKIAEDDLVPELIKGLIRY